MSCLFFVSSSTLNPRFDISSHSKICHNSFKLVAPGGLISRNSLLHLKFLRNLRQRSLVCSVQKNGEEPVDDLRVPDQWLNQSKAFEESEWLKVTLLKWLDDEYCPEATNIKISDIASRSFYNSLMNKQTDIGEILLEMVKNLESISYQDSFHGAFSSANAAISLIIQRIQPH